MSYYTGFANLLQCQMQGNMTPAPPASPTGSTYSFTSALHAQTVVAIAVEAKIIMDESSGTTNHAARLKWAKAALKDLLHYGPVYAYGVADDSTIAANGTGASADSDVQAAAHALVPTLVSGGIL